MPQRQPPRMGRGAPLRLGGIRAPGSCRAPGERRFHGAPADPGARSAQGAAPPRPPTRAHRARRARRARAPPPTRTHRTPRTCTELSQRASCTRAEREREMESESERESETRQGRAARRLGGTSTGASVAAVGSVHSAIVRMTVGLVPGASGLGRSGANVRSQ